MNQRSDLNEWLSQLFTERILNIDFCDCCKNGQLQQNPEIKVLSLEESYSSFREDNYNRNNTDKFPSSFQFNFEVFIDDNKYDVSFSSLAGRVTWFETSDIFAESVIYRPHIYVSYNDGKSISYEEKLKRITEWQDTFLVLDALMVDVENNISNQEMLALLKQGKIPRASLTEHGTRIRSFEYLISKINQQGNYTEASMKVPWELWIKAARENKIVEYWQEYKNKLMQ
jgi:hypothetical protein